MRDSPRWLMVCLCAGAFTACQDPGSNKGDSPGPAGHQASGSSGGSTRTPDVPDTARDGQERYMPDTPVVVGVELDPGHGIQVTPEPDALVRSRRRMDVDQLNASMRQVTNGIGWTETRSSTEVDLFVDLARTLGKPDFVDITAEDLEPTAIFMKFLDDAARSVCAKVITKETAPDAEGNVFFVHASPTSTMARNPAEVEQNLSYLLLRFHGRHVAPGSTELENWRWLMTSVQFVNPQQPVEAWRAVCVALFTHPDFYSY